MADSRGGEKFKRARKKILEKVKFQGRRSLVNKSTSSFYSQLYYNNVWFNSTLLPSPRAYTRGLTILFLLSSLFPTPGHAERDNSHPRDSPLVTHKRETTRLFVYKIKTTIFISVQNHTINISETHAVGSTSTLRLKFHYTSRFSRFVWCISVHLLI